MANAEITAPGYSRPSRATAAIKLVPLVTTSSMTTRGLVVFFNWLTSTSIESICCWMVGRSSAVLAKAAFGTALIRFKSILISEPIPTRISSSEMRLAGIKVPGFEAYSRRGQVDDIAFSTGGREPERHPTRGRARLRPPSFPPPVPARTKTPRD